MRRPVAAGVRFPPRLRILWAMRTRAWKMSDSVRLRRALLCGLICLPAAASVAAVPADAGPTGLLALFGGSGSQVNGSGNVIDAAREVTGFDRLIVQGPIDVRIQAADSDRVSVHADDNIAPLIETTLQGNALVIGLRQGASFRTRSRIYVKVQARAVHGIVLRGSSEVRADRIDADVFDATIQGAGDIRIESVLANAVAVSIAGSGDFRAAGEATSFGVVIDGAGDVYADKLQAKQVAVRIRGSGDARVHARDELKVVIDGSGDVRYRGTPKVSRRISGSGSVEPIR